LFPAGSSGGAVPPVSPREKSEVIYELRPICSQGSGRKPLEGGSPWGCVTPQGRGTRKGGRFPVLPLWASPILLISWFYSVIQCHARLF